MKRTEAEVARAVMDFMTEEGWDCYPEALLAYGGRADIVGVRPFPFCDRRCVHIIECKTTWSMSLLEQAIDRLAHAHYVTIAAPTEPRGFYVGICRDYGIGMMRFHRSADLSVNEFERLPPRLVRHKGRAPGFGPSRTLGMLHDDMKRYDPCTTSAHGYSSPWRRTMDAAARFVDEHPGCTINELLDGVETHYANRNGARQGLLVWLQKREDVDARKEGRCIRFYPPGAPSIQPGIL